MSSVHARRSGMLGLLGYDWSLPNNYSISLLLLLLLLLRLLLLLQLLLLLLLHYYCYY